MKCELCSSGQREGARKLCLPCLEAIARLWKIVNSVAGPAAGESVTVQAARSRQVRHGRQSWHPIEVGFEVVMSGSVFGVPALSGNRRLQLGVEGGPLPADGNVRFTAELLSAILNLVCPECGRRRGWTLERIQMPRTMRKRLAPRMGAPSGYKRTPTIT